MKQFIAFVKKEFFHIFRDRRTMLILLGMPVVQIILFGFAITTEVKNVRVGVLDPSNDIVTRKIIDRLDASEYFSVSSLPTAFIQVMPVCKWFPMQRIRIWLPHKPAMPQE